MLSLLVLGIGLWSFDLAKKDVHFTELAPDTGKLIKRGEDIVDIKFNSDKEHYDDNGTLVEGKQDLGWFFNLTGRVFFGISPIWEVFHFKTSWNEYAQGKLNEDGTRKPPSIISRTENGTTFKKNYTHAVMVMGAEMKREGGNSKDTTDTSTTRINAAMLLTMKITNINNAIYKVDPEGIVFAQADTAAEGAFNDHVKGCTWEEFRDKDKTSQDGEFVQYIINRANAVLAVLGIGMEVMVVELKYYDITLGPGSEDYEKSQLALRTADNIGNAEIALAKKRKEARKVDGEAEGEYFKAVHEIGGINDINTYAQLEQVKKTQLRVFGSEAVKKTLPIINTEGGGDKP